MAAFINILLLQDKKSYFYNYWINKNIEKQIKIY